jgi:hypothetical protein
LLSTQRGVRSSSPFLLQGRTSLNQEIISASFSSVTVHQFIFHLKSPMKNSYVLHLLVHRFIKNSYLLHIISVTVHQFIFHFKTQSRICTSTCWCCIFINRLSVIHLQYTTKTPSKRNKNTSVNNNYIALHYLPIW